MDLQHMDKNTLEGHGDRMGREVQVNRMGQLGQGDLRAVQVDRVYLAVREDQVDHRDPDSLLVLLTPPGQGVQVVLDVPVNLVDL